jgi:hypothetical protein
MQIRTSWWSHAILKKKNKKNHVSNSDKISYACSHVDWTFSPKRIAIRTSVALPQRPVDNGLRIEKSGVTVVLQKNIVNFFSWLKKSFNSYSITDPVIRRAGILAPWR